MMKCHVVVCLCLLLTLFTESESLKILKKIKDFLHPSTTTALPEREHEEKQDHGWTGEKDSEESSDSDSKSSERNSYSNNIGSGGVRSTARPSYSSGSGGNGNYGGSSGPGYETATIKSSDSLKPDHPFDVDDNSESQWGGPAAPAENGKNTNIYTSGVNNRQSTTEKQPSYGSPGSPSTYGSGQSTPVGSSYDNDQTTTGSQSSYNNGQSTSASSQSTFSNGQSTTESRPSSDNGQPTSAGTQSTYNNAQSTSEGSQSTYNNGQPTSAGSQSTFNNGLSTSAGSQSTFNNGQSTTQSSYNNGQSTPGGLQSTYGNGQSSSGSQSTYGNSQSNQNNRQSTKQPDSYNLPQSTTERQTNYGQNYDTQNYNETKNDSYAGALIYPDHPMLDPSPEPERSYGHHNLTDSSDPLESTTADPREGKAQATGVAVDDGRHVIDGPVKQCPLGQRLSNGICRAQARR